MKRSYDALIVLGGGITKQKTHFVSSTYADSDPFGMLGGRMRILAAVELYKKRVAAEFVFTSGVTAKSAEIYGPAIPSEASVYSQEFLELVAAAQLEQPAIILEDRSTNTIQNVREVLAIVRSRRWREVAILTSEYHVARVAALVALLQGAEPAPPAVDCLSAEKILSSYAPGMYDEQIEKAYASPQAKRRLQNEANGLRAILSGSYTPDEFQLTNRSKHNQPPGGERRAA